MSKYNQIISYLDQMDADYDLSEHEPVITSADAERVTGFPMHAAAKSIIFKVGDKFVLAVVRGTNLADYNKVRKIYSTRKARLASPEEVLEVMGVEVGACYPFGSIAGVEMIVDATLAENEFITFSPGSHTAHIRMPWDEYVRVTKPKLIDIVKN